VLENMVQSCGLGRRLDGHRSRDDSA